MLEALAKFRSSFIASRGWREAAAQISNHDLQVYEREILPHLPPKVVDAHVLLGLREHFREVPSGEGKTPELKFRHHLTVQGLFSNFKQILQHRKRRFVVLPFPYREVDLEAVNSYVAESAKKRSLRALLAMGEGNRTIFRKLLDMLGVVGAVVPLDSEREFSFNSLGHQTMALLAQKGGALMLFPSGKGIAEERTLKGVLSLAYYHPSLNIVLARAGGMLCPGTAEQVAPKARRGEKHLLRHGLRNLPQGVGNTLLSCWP